MPTTPTPSANLLQLLPEAVVQTDALWEITYLNPAWHKLTGHSVEAALGKSLLEFVHPDDIGTMRSGMPVFRLRFADADYRWVRLQFHPETDAAQRVISRQGPDRDHRGHRTGAGGGAPALFALAGNH